MRKHLTHIWPGGGNRLRGMIVGFPPRGCGRGQMTAGITCIARLSSRIADRLLSGGWWVVSRVRCWQYGRSFGSGYRLLVLLCGVIVLGESKAWFVFFWFLNRLSFNYLFHRIIFWELKNVFEEIIEITMLLTKLDCWCKWLICCLYVFLTCHIYDERWVLFVYEILSQFPIEKHNSLFTTSRWWSIQVRAIIIGIVIG